MRARVPEVAAGIGHAGLGRGRRGGSAEFAACGARRTWASS